MVTTLPEETEAVEDYEFAVTDSSGGGDEELIPPGRYTAQFVSFKVEPKPQWKIDAQRRYNPDREPKPEQATWTFEIVDEGYEGRKLSDWQDVSWHVKSNGAKYLAALWGVAKLKGTERGSISQFIGRVISIRVTENKGRNYIDPNGCEPVSQKKPAKGSPSDLLAQLQEAMDAAKLTRGELVVEWKAAGFAGRTREELSDTELKKAIKHFISIEPPPTEPDEASLEF
jgi:hypothetical protein